MTWDGTMETLNALTGNWAFEIRLYVKDGLTGQVFNNLSQAPLKLYDDLVSSGGASFYLRNYVTMSEWTGWHVIRLEVADGNASLYLDGMFQATKSTGTTITPVTQDSVTAADIWIDYVKLENLTSGSVLWHSEYRDTHAIYKARDFSTNYQWPAVGTALRTIPWTDDYHFHFVFTVPDSLSNGSYWLMYQSNGRIVFSLDKDARGCRFTFGSFAFADNLTVYTPFQPSLAGTHDVTLAVSGTMLSLALDGTVYEQTGERTASSEYDRAVTTSAPVTIHEITLTDDTSSTEVWHAAYIDLNAKYPALPWPAQVMYSPTPRNFAEEPATWYDLGLASSTIGMDDWEIGGELYANSLTAGKSIIYRSSDPRFGLYVTSSSQIIFVNYSATGSNERIYYYDNPPTGEWLSFKMQRAGGWLRWLINDIDVKSVEKTGLYVEMNNTSPFFVNEDCNLRNCYFKNLTTGRTVWSYPSEAERVRLITKTNVRTDRGAFEAADTSKVSGITTTLDLRGTPVEHTLIVSGYFPLPSNNGLLHYFPLLTQGAALDGTGDRVTVGLLVRVDYRNQQTTRDIQVVWADSSYTLHSVRATVHSEFFDKRHLIAATLLVDRKTSKWTTELYVDGVQLASNTGSLTRFVFGSAGSTTLGADSIQIQGRIYTGFLSESNKIEYALVMGRVLSAAEIKALTPGKQV